MLMLISFYELVAWWGISRGTNPQIIALVGVFSSLPRIWSGVLEPFEISAECPLTKKFSNTNQFASIILSPSSKV